MICTTVLILIVFIPNTFTLQPDLNEVASVILERLKILGGGAECTGAVLPAADEPATSDDLQTEDDKDIATPT